jgi:phage virion morphogenesis protein
MDDLSAVQAWAGALLMQLSPAGRRKATRDIARELRRSQQARIAAQKDPDGSGYEPRKIRSGGKQLRGKRGRLKRAAMFARLRTSRWMSMGWDDKELAVGFSGRIARMARVHQFGETSAVAHGGPKHRYPARVLLALTVLERKMVRDRLLADLTA